MVCLKRFKRATCRVGVRLVVILKSPATSGEIQTTGKLEKNRNVHYAHSEHLESKLKQNAVKSVVSAAIVL